MATHSSIPAWENPVGRGAWWATVHGVTKSQTQLSTHTHIHRSWAVFTWVIMQVPLQANVQGIAIRDRIPMDCFFQFPPLT